MSMTRKLPTITRAPKDRRGALELLEVALLIAVTMGLLAGAAASVGRIFL